MIRKSMIKKNMNRKTILLSIFLLLMTLPQLALGLSLDEAKQRGFVGETPSGYLQAVHSQPANVTALVQSINQKRRAEYEKIAREYRQSVDQVAQLAGKKAMKLSPKGTFVLRNGQWTQK